MRSTKKSVRPVWPAPPRAPEPARPPEKPEKEISRVTLALLDEYALEGEKRGYDPYNTRSDRSRG